VKFYSKVYLGDSVYAETTELGQLLLTTNNGEGPSNRIVLEPEVLDALLTFAAVAKSLTEAEP
jgi:hypothetical protein